MKSTRWSAKNIGQCTNPECVRLRSDWWTVQKTVRSDVILNGRALHSGRYCTVIVSPSPSGSGILIGESSRTQTRSRAVLPSDVIELENRAGFRLNGVQVESIEHLMAALAYLGITNLNINFSVGTEVPSFDGSAWPIVQILQDAGLVHQGVLPKRAEADANFSRRFGESSYSVKPSDSFRLDVSFNFGPLVSSKKFAEGDNEMFRLIIESKSFIFASEIAPLQTKGLCLNLSSENCEIIRSDQDLSPAILRQSVCHKMLDFVGDAYLVLGCIPRAAFVLVNPHHRLNARFLKECAGDNILTQARKSSR